VNGGGLRIDFGKPISADRIELACTQRLQKDPPPAEISLDLKKWTPLKMSGGKTITITIPKGTKFRYLRMTGFSRHPSVIEVNAYAGDTALDRKLWHASNLFSAFDKMNFKKALSAKIISRSGILLALIKAAKSSLKTIYNIRILYEWHY